LGRVDLAGTVEVVVAAVVAGDERKGADASPAAVF
jgi:hypothetical protein